MMGFRQTIWWGNTPRRRHAGAAEAVPEAGSLRPEAAGV